MGSRVTDFVYHGVKRAIKVAHRRRKRPRAFSEFLPLKETLAAAGAVGLSVGDYIDSKHHDHATQDTIDGLKSLGVFGSKIETVCEIGPGSGRYLERVIRACRPAHYEIYETAADWANWLAQKHQVVLQPCDGRTLSATPSDSMDLVHTHKLFPCRPILYTCSYWQEMCRVTKKGGLVVFDIATEQCLSGPYLKSWMEEQPWDWDWTPYLISRSFVSDFFAQNGFTLVGSFFIPLWPGRTECFAFRKS